MNKAYIYFDEENNFNFDGEGEYVLVFNNKIIGNHYCSNRSFANHDLTIWRLEELKKYNIDQVISNDEVVWQKDNEEINDKTQNEFNIANANYEAKYCK